MKVLVWMCRTLYVSLIGLILAFVVLKDDNPVRALQAALAGFVAFLLLIACIWVNNHVMAKRRERRRPRLARSDEPPLSIGRWRVVPEELVGQPRWEYDGTMTHVVDGVTSF